MRHLAALLALILLGCGPKEAPKPAEAPDAAPAKPAPPRVADEAARRARYEARPHALLPVEVPKPFRNMAKILEGRWISASYEYQSRVDKARPYERLSLKIRAFDKDTDIANRLLEHLRRLKLPGLEKGVPDSPVQADGLKWSLKIRRLVAPAGAAREHRLDFEWAVDAAPPAEGAPDCRKPPSVDAPSITPAWLKRVTKRRSTRHRVSASVSRSAEEEAVLLRMLYRNGEAHDEGVGHLISAAKSAGFRHQRGEGARQIWAHASGETFAWRPDPDPLKLGCRLTGPVLHLTWTHPLNAPKP